VPRIGITGHARLSDASVELVFASLTDALREYDGATLHGITCLAEGADRIFARAVLALHGSLEVIVPARDYRLRAVAPDGADEFDELIGRAVRVRTMPFENSGRDAYLAASEDMLSRCDLLLAVWDGFPSQVVGDTAHVVSAARLRRIPIRILWPAGAGRR
jgi:hypothetical protein